MTPSDFFQGIRWAWFTALLALSALPAQAANCTISSASGLSFGPYNVFNTSPTTGSGTLTVDSCSTGKPTYTAALSTGISGTYSLRTMTNGTNTLQYNLYTTSGHTNVWGDGTGSTRTVGGNGTSSSTQTIYGNIPAGQDVSAGTYSDSITLTISF